MPAEWTTDDSLQRQPFGVDKAINLAPLDLLPGVISYLAIKTAPISAAFGICGELARMSQYAGSSPLACTS